MPVFREPVQRRIREDRIELLLVGKSIGAVQFYIQTASS